MDSNFITSLPAQAAARCIIDTAKALDLLTGPVTVSPQLADAEKTLFIKMLKAMDEHRKVHGDTLQPDEISSLFTFVFAKAAESVTNMFNHKTDAFELTGMFDGRIPVYADDSITNEFKNSPVPFSCAENYLQWVENDAQHLVGCDMTLLLFEALKWCFRLSCHYAMTIVENK